MNANDQDRWNVAMYQVDPKSPKGKAACHALMKKYHKWVFRCVQNAYYVNEQDHRDVYSELMTNAFIDAIRCYNPAKPAIFKTYLGEVIKRRLPRATRRVTCTISGEISARLDVIKRATAELESENVRHPSAHDVFNHLEKTRKCANDKITPFLIRRIWNSQDVSSMDAKILRENDARPVTMHGLIGKRDVIYDYDDNETPEKLHAAIAELPERERTIILEHSLGGRTMTEMKTEFGKNGTPISDARMWQIKKKAMTLLTQKLIPESCATPPQHEPHEVCRGQ